jgi:hypothetical protein
MKIVSFTADFSNKIKGSLVENAHIARNTHYSDSGGYDTRGNILFPSQVPELSAQFKYDYLKTRNGSGLISYGDDNTRSQFIASFNLLWAVEQQYGASIWGGAITVADKIERLKTFFSSATCYITATGYTTNGGNYVYKKYLSLLKNTNEWTSPSSSTESGATDIGAGFALLDGFIDTDGYIHVNCYTDLDTTANGTYNSILNVDYVWVNIRVDEDKMTLSAPTGLTAVGDIGKVNLSWDFNESATSYYVLRSSISGQNYGVIAHVTEPNHVDVMSNPLDNKTYYYRVIALNSLGESPKSIEVAATPIPTYEEFTVFVHPSEWVGDLLGEDAKNRIITQYNRPGKRQTVETQKPYLVIRTYND